jgi:hypothetical protein
VRKFEIGFVWQTGRRTEIETSLIGWFMSHFKNKNKIEI